MQADTHSVLPQKILILHNAMLQIIFIIIIGEEEEKVRRTFYIVMEPLDLHDYHREMK